MAPRKRRDVGRLKGHEAAIGPQTSLGTQAVNARGFPALAHEIYLEIIPHIPSPPIPTDTDPLYPEIRRSRHETLLSLSQTCRSLRKFFWRYLWQRIEVREGMKIGDENDSSEATPYLCSSRSGNKQALKNYAIELVRQLEIVTVRNPQLAQYVNYVDVFIGDYSIDTVLVELARCLSLFPNLHTVQIDVTSSSRRSLDSVFGRVFKKHSYPQIRNVFVMFLSQPFIQACPEAIHVGFTHGWVLSMSSLRAIIDNCPRLEVLDNFPELFWRADTCKLVVDSFPHLRSITISPSTRVAQIFPHQIDTLKRLNHLHTIIILWKPILIRELWAVSVLERGAHLERLKQEWIERAKYVLIAVQRRDNLEKVVIIREAERERKILVPPVGNLKEDLQLAT